MKIKQAINSGCRLLAVAMAAAGTIEAATITNFATADGDASYAWNSKYGPYGYTTGGSSLGVGLSMGGTYGNDYTMSVFEISLAGVTPLSLQDATLKVYSNGFSTGYYYGSAGMRWLDPAAVVLTGNPVADGLGPILGSTSVEYLLWDSAQPAGWYEFDVTTHVLADLNAGRGFSSFVLNGSRDTGGSIRAAEYGDSFGPQMDFTVVPEPSSFGLGVLGGVLLVLRRRRL